MPGKEITAQSVNSSIDPEISGTTRIVDIVQSMDRASFPQALVIGISCATALTIIVGVIGLVFFIRRRRTKLNNGSKMPQAEEFAVSTVEISPDCDDEPTMVTITSSSS